MSNQTLLNVYSAIAGAVAVCGIDQKVVSKKWNKTSANPVAFERAVVLPMECVSATSSEVSDTFRALVNSALQSAAVSVLETEMKQNQNNTQLPLWKFERPALIEAFLGGDSWMTKEELEKAWDSSESWKKLVSNPKYSSNAIYKQQANMLRENMLKLAGKATKFSADACDKLIVRIVDEDAETEVGSFLLKRLIALKTEAQNAVVDFDALD
jgi:hypothetical protein